jgi:hypothetical protein
MPKDGEVIIPVDGGVPQTPGSGDGGSRMDPDTMKLLLGSMGRTIEMANQGSAHYAEDSRRQWLQNSTQVTQTSAVAMRTMSGPHLYHGSPDGKV